MNIIDRRLNPKSKSLGNRQRFLRRAKADIKEAIKDAVDKRNLSDGSKGGVKVKTKSVSEPILSPDYSTGNRDFILPGNREYVVGDTIQRPRRDGAGGAGGGAGTETSEDDFEFILNTDEFLDYFFDDLKLPDMVKKNLKKSKKVSFARAGFTSEGPPARLSTVRTMRKSLGRRISLGRPSQEEIDRLEREIKAAEENENFELALALREEFEKLTSRRMVVPFIDPIDLQFSRLEKFQKPATQAVMFCLMDVSASMSENLKNLAKRFFILLHIFLKRHYKEVEVVFIRHTTEAKTVDENEFFTSKESGGTIVSTCLEEMMKNIKDKYDPADWNIYAAQASDGDNVSDDTPICIDLLKNHILPVSQYFAYIEINDSRHLDMMYDTTTDLWKGYSTITEKNFNKQKVKGLSDIYPVFHELFSKERD